MKKSILKKLAVALRFDLVIKRINKSTKISKTTEKAAGRIGYGDVSLLSSKILSGLFSASGNRDIQRKLQEDKELRKIFNLKKAPTYSCYSKWLKRKGIEFLSNVMKELVKIAIRINLINCSLLAVDSTGINAFVSKVKENYESDKDAKWGFLKKDKKGNKILFYGYKVHLFVDCKSELPLAFVVLPANVHDAKGFWYAFYQLKKTIPLYLVKKILADSGYDSSKIKQLFRDININPVIACNGRGKRKSSTPKDVDYPQRWAIERNNGLMKKYYHLNSLEIKGINAAIFNSYLSYISMLASSIGKYLLGYKRYRQIY